MSKYRLIVRLPGVVPGNSTYWLLHGVFSNCSEQGYSSLHCTGFLLQWLLLWRRTGWRAPSFSSCGMWAWQLAFPGSKAQAQQLWWMGWVAPWHLGSSWIKDHTWVSCIGGWILYHSHKGSPSSRIFMASGLMIKVFNPFWVNFCEWCKFFSFILLRVTIQLSQHHFWRDSPFPML